MSDDEIQAMLDLALPCNFGCQTTHVAGELLPEGQHWSECRAAGRDAVRPLLAKLQDKARNARESAESRGAALERAEAGLEAAQSRVARLREALQTAIATIEALHGPAAWDIFFEQSPEMKKIRAAAEGE